MNASYLARLEVAKRAFRATEPNATEVQRGVRRARLALQRPRSRRRWFSKGAVMLVLAVGGLAYAKPQALSEFVGSALESHRAASKHGTVLGAAALTLPKDPAASGASQHEPGPALSPPAAAPALALVAKPAQAEPAHAALKTTDTARAAAAPVVDASASRQSQASASVPAPKVRTGASTAEAAAPVAISDWGRVAQALAQGDETQALSALNTLSESTDQRTRDKADLGRAQLLLANGDREAACVLARYLTHRHAGSRIDRQAQAILNSCK